MSGQRGFVFVATILSTVTLLSFCGLAIDVGYLFLVKTRMQTAADAAALGGVQELRTNGSGGLVAAAKADSAVNGFTDGLKGVTITVNRPPLSGYYTSDPTAVEVVVAQNSPHFLHAGAGLRLHAGARASGGAAGGRQHLRICPEPHHLQSGLGDRNQRPHIPLRNFCEFE